MHSKLIYCGLAHFDSHRRKYETVWLQQEKLENVNPYMEKMMSNGSSTTYPPIHERPCHHRSQAHSGSGSAAVVIRFTIPWNYAGNKSRWYSRFSI